MSNYLTDHATADVAICHLCTYRVRRSDRVVVLAFPEGRAEAGAVRRAERVQAARPVAHLACWEGR